jgi:CRISPR system Cascade subunit CasA
MNLIDHPWIPVRLQNGASQLASLRDIFSRPSDFANLSLAPHERIAVTRLLVCITQAAIGFPEHDEAWDAFGENLEEQAMRYLTEWHESFELFGEGRRFLQSRIPAEDTVYHIHQMVYMIASGNTPTTLDNRVPSPPRDSDLALSLLAYQNFFVGGSMASKVKGNGPALKSLHTFLKGQSLRRVILLNCLDLETAAYMPDLGRPIWERPDDEENATRTYLGRLVPTPCKIWLHSDHQHALIDQGFIYPAYEEIPPESSAATVIWKSGETETPRLLRASPNRGIWRDLHALTILRRADGGSSAAPAILQSHYHQFGGSSAMPIWCGELIKAKDAKILDATESTFHLPLTLFKEHGRQLYDLGVRHADFRGNLLRDAVRLYGKTLKIDKPATSGAERHYWHRLDQQSEKLLEVVQCPGLLDKDRFGISSDPWSQAVHRAALDAYEAHCPRTTPRQIQAHAEGLTKLFPRKKKAAAKSSAQPS